MAKFRKKPVVVEAMQLTYEDDGVAKIMEWAASSNSVIRFSPDHGMTIDTLEGVMRADLGDWIIKGVEGEFYPCKPDIFAKTYEAVPVAGEMDREATLRALCRADCFHWRVLAGNWCKGTCQANGFQLETRYGSAADALAAFTPTKDRSQV